MRKNIKLFAVLILILVVGVSFLLSKKSNSQVETDRLTLWEIQSIDTVKYSRDVAREKAKDPSFDEVIDTQVRLIAEVGATHVAISTPYDSEFVPFLTRWVKAARKYDLNVWFRGNLSGWERWFGYQKITREEHIQNIREFILGNGELFAEGDIFSSCTECENGGPGDPRRTGDVKGHRNFLIEEYNVTREAFRKIGENVRSNFAPMNGDVAELVMDEGTTNSLGNLVVIDHYVGSTDKLASDIEKIAAKSKGKVMLGEFGAPIANIHADFNEREQSVWIKEALSEISDIPELLGVNYWTSFGGSTRLWDSDYRERLAVETVRSFYKPKVLAGKVLDERGYPVKTAYVIEGKKEAATSNKGDFRIPIISENSVMTITAEGFVTQKYTTRGEDEVTIILIKEKEGILFRIQKLFSNIFK